MNIFDQNDLFIKYCQEGQIFKAKKLNYSNKLDVHAENDKPFRFACLNGQFRVAEWLQQEGADVHAMYDSAFRGSCANGHLKLARWLFAFKPDIHALADDAFRRCCANGHMDVAKFLLSLDSKIDIHSLKEWAFRKSCENGHLELAQWLYYNLSNRKIDIHAEQNYAFKNSVANGHLEIGKWLYSLGQINPPDKISALISKSTGIIRGKFMDVQTVDWLYSLGCPLFRKPPYHEEYKDYLDQYPVELADYLYSKNKITVNELFFNICCNGLLDRAKDLYYSNQVDLEKMDKNRNEESLLALVCEKGHQEMAEWLYSLNPDYFKPHLNFSFAYSCGEGYFKLAKWLDSLDGTFNSEYYDEAFGSACYGGHLEIAKWLYENDYTNFPESDPDSNMLFESVCRNDQLETAQWLYYKFLEKRFRDGFYNVEDNDDSNSNPRAFELDGLIKDNTLSSASLPTCKWLFSLLPYKTNKHFKECIDSSSMNDDVEVFMWFYQQVNIDLNDDYFYQLDSGQENHLWLGEDENCLEIKKILFSKGIQIRKDKSNGSSIKNPVIKEFLEKEKHLKS